MIKEGQCLSQTESAAVAISTGLCGCGRTQLPSGFSNNSSKTKVLSSVIFWFFSWLLKTFLGGWGWAGAMWVWRSVFKILQPSFFFRHWQKSSHYTEKIRQICSTLHPPHPPAPSLSQMGLLRSSCVPFVSDMKWNDEMISSGRLTLALDVLCNSVHAWTYRSELWSHEVATGIIVGLFNVQLESLNITLHSRLGGREGGGVLKENWI